MTYRDRFVNCVLGEPVDRPPFWLFWDPWESTWERWCNGEKPSSVVDTRMRYEPDFPPLPAPVQCGPCPAFEAKVLAEDAESITHIDSWGITRRTFKGRESMPQFLDFPVKNRRDWEQYKEEHLDPDHPDRLAGDWAEMLPNWAAAGIPIQLGSFPDVGLYGGVRWLLGDEECLMAFCTMPDLVHEIIDHLTSVYLTVYASVVKVVQVDVLHMWEDMCSRQGPLISPQFWEEFMAPGYRRIRAFADANNIPVLSVDTDGRPDLIVPPMMDAGVNFLYPMEVAAGCDVNAYRRDFPELAMMGGIDKRVLALDPEAIDQELERVRPAIESGRYVADLDHMIPDDVPWQNYDYYARSLKKLVCGEST